MSEAFDAVKVGIVSVSDRASAGVYVDKGLPALKDWRLGTACDGDSPNTWDTTAFRIIKELAVRRLEAFKPTLLRQLHGRPTFGRHLPNLQASAASRTEIDPSPIS